jgi:glutamine synthetase
VYVGWAQINRSALIRTPLYAPGREKSIRAELRCPDPSANPYLALAAMLAAALDGIEQDLDVPEPLNEINVYHLTREEREEQNIAELPGSLAEALQVLDSDELLKESLGPVIYESFQRAKWAEVEEYRTRVTDWEVSRYLETT